MAPRYGYGEFDRPTIKYRIVRNRRKGNFIDAPSLQNNVTDDLSFYSILRINWGGGGRRYAAS